MPQALALKTQSFLFSPSWKYRDRSGWNRLPSKEGCGSCQSWLYSSEKWHETLVSPSCNLRTGVSLRLVLSGEPDAFGLAFLPARRLRLYFLITVSERSVQRVREQMMIWSFERVSSPARFHLLGERQWWEQKTRVDVLLLLIRMYRVYWDPSFFIHCSHRAQDPGTLLCVAQCLHRLISRMRTTTVWGRGVCRRHPETHFRGIYPGTNAPSAKSTAARCWIRPREPCSGSQVRSTGCFIPDTSQLAA